MAITSKDNEKIKLLRKLKLKKYREQLALFKVENFKIISEAIAGKIEPEQVIVTQDFLDKYKSEFAKFNLDYHLVDKKVYKSFSELETPQGICAVFVKGESKLNFKSPVIYLNAINDPGNLGTILRSAVAFGYKNIIVDELCADVYNSKTIQASKGAIFKLNIEQDEGLKLLDLIQSKKIEVLASLLGQESHNLEDIKVKDNYCLVLGNESQGIDKEVKSRADEFIKIKISSDMESLNVANAAAIIMHHLKNL